MKRPFFSFLFFFQTLFLLSPDPAHANLCNSGKALIAWGMAFFVKPPETVPLPKGREMPREFPQAIFRHDLSRGLIKQDDVITVLIEGSEEMLVGKVLNIDGQNVTVHDWNIHTFSLSQVKAGSVTNFTVILEKSIGKGLLIDTIGDEMFITPDNKQIYVRNSTYSVEVVDVANGWVSLKIKWDGYPNGRDFSDYPVLRTRVEHVSFAPRDITWHSISRS